MFADSNYYLQNNSPCIDKGDSNAIYNDPRNPNDTLNALYPSKGTVRNDMGAYGGPLSRVLSGQLIGIHQVNESVPFGFMLYQNYPNPFNPVTKIKFNISALGPPSKGDRGMIISIDIFDILGRQVAVLLNRYLSPGSYEISFDALNYPSGVYFYRLEAGEFKQTNKMILIK
jgi:hypothetical protein